MLGAEHAGRQPCTSCNLLMLHELQHHRETGLWSVHRHPPNHVQHTNSSALTATKLTNSPNRDFGVPKNGEDGEKWGGMGKTGGKVGKWRNGGKGGGAGGMEK